ncbi:hypothetical protein AB0M39_11435 [Streptomyces sp. NPDC051907]|uniref:hypothetical protein n=1 Tax=Streptomyces sp. NPDC051907 TaxID=3155284 RepID=UPI00343E9F12
MNLRMIGLAGAVVFATLLPLAASAGPAMDDAKPADPDPRSEPGQKPGLLAGLGASDEPSEAGESKAANATEKPAPQTTARCGPELASPDGVEAQTCVLTDGRDTWARTYYRNATARELISVLTLMGPGGRTLQINCAVEAGDEPDACETPREAARGAVAQYSAVAEFAPADEAEDGPLLLRSGSNSAEPAGR